LQQPDVEYEGDHSDHNHGEEDSCDLDGDSIHGDPLPDWSAARVRSLLIDYVRTALKAP
jgi:hypothetical protein